MTPCKMKAWRCRRRRYLPRLVVVVVVVVAFDQSRIRQDGNFFSLYLTLIGSLTRRRAVRCLTA